MFSYHLFTLNEGQVIEVPSNDGCMLLRGEVRDRRMLQLRLVLINVKGALQQLLALAVVALHGKGLSQV